MAKVLIHLTTGLENPTKAALAFLNIPYFLRVTRGASFGRRRWGSVMEVVVRKRGQDSASQPKASNSKGNRV